MADLIIGRAANAPPVAQVGFERLVGGTVKQCVADLGQRVPELEVGVEAALRNRLQPFEVLDLCAGEVVVGVGAAHWSHASFRPCVRSFARAEAVVVPALPIARGAIFSYLSDGRLTQFISRRPPAGASASR